MPVRDFDAARAEAAGEPVVFRVAGREWTVPRHVPGGAILDLVANADAGNDTAAQARAAGALWRFLVACLGDQAEEFRTLTATTPLGTLVELAMWLVEELTGVPFGQQPS